MITAGIHGNERASVVAAKKLLRLLEIESLRIHKGTLIIVPIVNQIAYNKRIRGVPDLNRTFLLNIKKQARHPLSAALFRLALDFQPDWYIDLHEANGLSQKDSRVLGQTLITNPGSNAVPAVKRVINLINRSIAQKSQLFMMRLYSLPGSGRTAAQRLLKSKSITVETCWSLPISSRVQFQSKILHSLLEETGLLRAHASSPLKSGNVQQRKDPPDLIISEISTSITSYPLFLSCLFTS
jgi:predicted deacylase